VPHQGPPPRLESAATTPIADPSAGYRQAPAAAPSQHSAVAPAPTALPPTGYRPSGATAISAGVFALLIALYRAFQTYVYIATATMFAGIPGELASYSRGPQAFVTIAAIVSAVGTVALFVGAIKLLNRGLGGRGLITFGCLIAIADVIVTWIAVIAFMRGVSGFFSSAVGDSSGSIFSSVMNEQLPGVVFNVGLGVGFPLLTMILAWTQSTRRWCEAPRLPAPPSGAVGVTTPAPTPQPDVASPTPDRQPHAEYQRQAGQHFGAAYLRRTAGWGQSSYPTTQPSAPERPAYSSHSSMDAKDSIVTRLMEKGMRGELFQQPWFQKFRNESPDQFVFISYASAILLSFLLLMIPSTFICTVTTSALWFGIGYLYLALGTKIAHQFFEFGICLIGALVMLVQVWSVVSALSINSNFARLTGIGVEPTAVLVLALLLNIAVAAVLVYVGFQVHREIQRLSAP
jgi:hypothetical protein